MSIAEDHGSTTSAAQAPVAHDRRTFRRVAVASLIGTLIDGYDFVLFSLAASLVFPKVFFPSLGPAAGTVASLATLGVAFIARPIGGILFGHFGDRLGRKRMLVATIVTMGFGTTLMGFLPSASTIGIAAPILLVVLRFVQGLAVGGEWAGSVLFATEHAPGGRRGLYAMFPQFGHSAPTMLSAASLLLISVLTTPESFIDWGWRIPFIASALLVAFGLYVRSRIEETPIFEREQERRGVVKAPLFEAFKAQPVAILRGAGVPLVAITFSYTASAFISNYGVDHLSLSRNQVIGATAVGGLMYTIFTLLGSVVSDRVGRKRILTSAQLAAAAWALCLFPILNTGTVFAYYLVLCLTFATAGAGYGAVGAFLPEQFKTRYRMSAIGVSYNLGGILGGGIIPLVAPVIIGSAGSTVFGIILAAICIISFACTASLKDVTTKSMEY